MSLLVRVRLKNGGIDGLSSVDMLSKCPPLSIEKMPVCFFPLLQEIQAVVWDLGLLIPSGHFKTRVKILSVSIAAEGWRNLCFPKSLNSPCAAAAAFNI